MQPLPRVLVYARDHSRRVDSVGHGERRAGEIEGYEASLFRSPQEPMRHTFRVGIISCDGTRGGDPQAVGFDGVRASKVMSSPWGERRKP